ncbi:MAG: phosphoenolpyruvate--protein phosphotransferase [Alphaproteobacteria bacterium]|nr:phosphoenolpyruvate--protein phosphotransferase [Alphaproteobacteria bacterium]
MAADPHSWTPGPSNPSRTREETESDFVEAQMALAGPRQIMLRLRAIMAEDLPAERRLDRIVTLVARELRADVCSCFIQRAGEVIELFSTVGLPADVAHSAKLRVGEGFIGDIAAGAVPLVLSDVTTHPQFALRPETGGADYRGFCGVPVLRGGHVRGVLVIQNKLPRSYGPEVIDILETIAMVVAELIVAGGIISRQELSSGTAGGERPNLVEGVTLGRGLAMGTVVLYDAGHGLQHIIAEDVRAEKARLADALGSMNDAIDRMLNRSAVAAGTESRDILEAYQMFARDRGWLAKIEAAIDKGLSAEAAVMRVQNETRVRMMKVSDAYIRDRMADIEDLSNRLMGHLTRLSHAATGDAREETLPDSFILAARALGPAALLDYDPARLKGVILEKGSYSNHVAIVARALGIPVVGQCRDILNFINAGDLALVDGDHGTVYINPSEYLQDIYAKSIETRRLRTSEYRRHMPQQTVTRDGIRVGVMMNAGLMPEVDAALALGAEGIGLFRTELSFMGWQKYPLVVTQAELYGRIMDKMDGKPVVFRTLDIGGDKPLPYFKAPDEENPALGWRAVRIGMDRPAVLRTQFRAFIRGSKGRPLHILLPFVTEAAELDRACALLEMEKLRAHKNGIAVPEKIALGVMLEVPALLFQLDQILKTVDFIAVGTNDLMQYLYAADRSNHAIRGRYDPLSPAMLRVLKTIADQCRAANVPVSVCGEMAGHPLEAMVLIALGFGTLSVPAQSIEAIKTMIPTLDTRRLVPYLEHLMASREHSLRERLLSFARDHDIQIISVN